MDPTMVGDGVKNLGRTLSTFDTVTVDGKSLTFDTGYPVQIG